MKKPLSFIVFAFAAGAVFAQDINPLPSSAVMDPDFGLTLDTPQGFEAEMIGQTEDGSILITVSSLRSGLTAFDPGDPLCEITFHYDPAFGQGDQAWVNRLVDGTGFYETMARHVIVPGRIKSSEDFSHKGSSAHRFLGEHEQGGSFLVAAIPSTKGYALVSCVSAQPNQTFEELEPMIDAIVVPGQSREGLVAFGKCEADLANLNTIIEGKIPKDLDATTIKALDVERDSISAQCGSLHAETMMDSAVIKAGLSQSYREMRYSALAQIGSHLLTNEQHAALAGGRQQVETKADPGTGERYIRYMHFIVGLRSLN